jgi:hypothetical protein
MAPLAALARRAAFAATALALSAAAGAATAAGLLLLFLLSPRAFLRRTDWAALELPPATAAPLSHEFVETEAGVVIHIARTGSGDGTKKKPLMLLLHGFPERECSFFLDRTVDKENNQVTARKSQIGDLGTAKSTPFAAPGTSPRSTCAAMGRAPSREGRRRTRSAASPPTSPRSRARSAAARPSRSSATTGEASAQLDLFHLIHFIACV